jgi:small-conductance mechanosensitive channel
LTLPGRRIDRGTEPRWRLSDARGHVLREVALARHLHRRAVRRARIESLVLVPALVGVLVAYSERRKLFDAEWDQAIRLLTAVALMFMGWQFARDIGRALGPILFRRLEPATAGTAGFLIRLATAVTTTVVALRVAGLTPRTLALGGALTAVVVGLAAQQTLGNLFAGTVLLSARPFRVGERVLLQGGPLAGTVEGVVSSLGLLYTTLARGDDAIMVPNSVVLNVAVVPLREPTAVELRARLRPGITPLDVDRTLRESIQTPVRGAPSVTLEEVDGEDTVVRVRATPDRPGDGPQLAGEVLAAVTALAPGRGETAAEGASRA